MSDKNRSETVADIVAELRDCPLFSMTARIDRIVSCKLADRIEAAFVRNNDDYNCEITRLREALRGLCDWLSDGIKGRGSINPHWAKAMDALKGEAK